MLPVKDDLILQIEDDCDYLGIEFDEVVIRNTKKDAFKNLVKEKMKEYSHSYLLQEKEKLKKLENFSSHYGMKEYLSNARLSLDQKQLLFNLWTRMIEVKCNYKSKYEENLLCSLCQTNSMESQEHLLVCPTLIPLSDIITNVKYMDIFDNLEKQMEAAKYWSKIMVKRKIKFKEKEFSSLRSHVHYFLWCLVYNFNVQGASEKTRISDYQCIIFIFRVKYHPPKKAFNC